MATARSRLTVASRGKAVAAERRAVPELGHAPSRGSERSERGSIVTTPQKHLDVFPNPAPGRDYAIEFEIPEFTCLCPLTGQPDYARFSIAMVCDTLCIELKSLKLYLWSYRDEGAFHEKVTNAILDDIVAATAPRYARIRARWNVRGGIYTTVVAEHRAGGWVPVEPVVVSRG